MDRKTKLMMLVLKYFVNSARTTNFYKDPIFDGYSKDEVVEMRDSCLGTMFLQRVDYATTNGAAFMTTKAGLKYLKELEAMESAKEHA